MKMKRKCMLSCNLSDSSLTVVNCIITLRSVSLVALSLNVIVCTTFIILFVGQQSNQVYQPVLGSGHSSWLLSTTVLLEMSVANAI